MRTSNPDRLAAEGARCSQYIAAAPIGVSRRAAMFTGPMPHAVSVTAQKPIHSHAICLAARCRRAGYRTVLGDTLQIRTDPARVGVPRCCRSSPASLLPARRRSAREGQ